MKLQMPEQQKQETGKTRKKKIPIAMDYRSVCD